MNNEFDVFVTECAIVAYAIFMAGAIMIDKDAFYVLSRDFDGENYIPEQ